MKKDRLIYGWGINDADYEVSNRKFIEGKWKCTWVCPYYADWVRMIERCFSVKRQKRQEYYKDCTVCEEWKYFSNFKKWVDTQPNKDWQNCELDKDFLIHENKIYSPYTCVYIPKRLNLFITDSRKTRGIFMIGVTYGNNVNPFTALCRNPFTIKQDYLGVFKTELEAHKAWQAKKHEYACQLADLQQDPRVAKVLRERYAPDKDWTKV